MSTHKLDARVRH